MAPETKQAKSPMLGNSIQEMFKKTKTSSSLKDYFGALYEREVNKAEKLSNGKFSLSAATKAFSNLKEKELVITPKTDNYHKILVDNLLKQPGTYFYDSRKPYFRRRTAMCFHLIKSFESHLNTSFLEPGDKIKITGSPKPSLIFTLGKEKKDVTFDLSTYQFLNPGDIPEKYCSLSESLKAKKTT